MEKCNQKWIILDEKMSIEYETSPRKCKICHKVNYPQFVDSEDDCSGDYTCYKCNRSGKIKIFCYYCKKKYN